jgi:Condensation domain
LVLELQVNFAAQVHHLLAELERAFRAIHLPEFEADKSCSPRVADLTTTIHSTKQNPVAGAKSNMGSPVVRQVSQIERTRLEEHLRQRLEKNMPSTSESVLRRCASVAVPLTLCQEQVYLRAQRNADKPPFYNETITVHRRGPLDAGVVESSLLEIIRRHEIWRSTFAEVEGRLIQIVNPPPVDWHLPRLDVSTLVGSAQEAELLRAITEMAERPFDLEKGPLLRFLLVKLDEVRHRLVLVAHQIVVDGVSAYQLLPLELAILYDAFSNGKPSPLAELEIQFGDYAVWQRNGSRAEAADLQVSYWRERLGGRLPALPWPEKRADAASSHRGVIQAFKLTPRVSATLRSVSQREGVTLFMFLLSGLVALLHHYTALEDVLVGTLSTASRNQSQLQRLLGYFLNPVALRFDLCGDPAFLDLLRQSREVLSEAISHDDVPIELLAEKLGLNASYRHLPPLNVGICLQPPVPQGLRPEWDVTSMDVGSGGTVWDLYLAFINTPDGVLGRAQYNADVFPAETVAQVLADLEAILDASASQPHLRLSELCTSIDGAAVPENRAGAIY